MSDKIFNRCLAVLAIVAVVLIWTDSRGQSTTDTECEQAHKGKHL